MKIKKKIVAKGIYQLVFKSQYDLGMTFVRLQEFYESQKFKNKFFTLEEYIDYWSSEFGNGIFDYPMRWAGFNVPSKVIEKWLLRFSCEREGLRDKEVELIHLIEKMNDKDRAKKYYVIATYNDGSNDKEMTNVLAHEYAHALYSLSPEYKRKCNALIKKMPKEEYDKKAKRIIELGYNKSVINDEIQAYLSEPNSLDWFDQEFLDNFSGSFEMYKKNGKKKNNKKKVKMCERCGKNPALEPHTCPYDEEINGDYETLFTCCDECCDECAQDI